MPECREISAQLSEVSQSIQAKSAKLIGEAVQHKIEETTEAKGKQTEIYDDSLKKSQSARQYFKNCSTYATLYNATP